MPSLIKLDYNTDQHNAKNTTPFAYMAKVIESSVNRFVCSNISFHNYVVHRWRILGSRLELWFHSERGKRQGSAGILSQNEVY